MSAKAHSLRPLRASRSVRAALILIVIISGVSGEAAPAGADSPDPVIFREDFDSLDRWEPLKFSKIENMCTYTLDPQADKTCYVKAQSSDSASGMVWQGEFNVYDHPMIRWRWRVSNVYTRGNALTKKGDDYPLRIYVMFKYDREDPNVKKKFKYGLGKLLYGEYPPYASINYIWANREHEQQFIPNPNLFDRIPGQ